jgi:hypothetical protein
MGTKNINKYQNSTDYLVLKLEPSKGLLNKNKGKLLNQDDFV